MVEATFPFAPPDLMLAPMVLARRERAWAYAAICTAGSVTGGMIGYAIGFLSGGRRQRDPGALRPRQRAGRLPRLVRSVGARGHPDQGPDPVPYMLVTLASGLAHFSFPVFVAASVATRGGRFFLEAALLQHPMAKAIVDRYFYWIAIAGIVAIIAAVVVLRRFGGV